MMKHCGPENLASRRARQMELGPPIAKADLRRVRWTGQGFELHRKAPQWPTG